MRKIKKRPSGMPTIQETDLSPITKSTSNRLPDNPATRADMGEYADIQKKIAALFPSSHTRHISAVYKDRREQTIHWNASIASAILPRAVPRSTSLPSHGNQRTITLKNPVMPSRNTKKSFRKNSIEDHFPIHTKPQNQKPDQKQVTTKTHVPEFEDMLSTIVSEMEKIDLKRTELVKEPDTGASLAVSARCGGCYGSIANTSKGFEIEALEQWFHPACFRCYICKEEFSQDLPYIPHGGKAYCEKDYEITFNAICADCDEPIEGRPIHALGQLWHPEHLKCSACEQVITTAHFEHENAVYCAADYAKWLAPRCADCTRPITGETVFALGGSYHKSCFCCTTCKETFPDNAFYISDERPYCRYHYHQKNGSLCGKCKEPIEGPCAEVAEWGKKYHPECWTCSKCHLPLTGTYYSVDGQVVCEKDVQKANQNQRRITRIIV